MSNAHVANANTEIAHFKTCADIACGLAWIGVTVGIVLGTEILWLKVTVSVAAYALAVLLSKWATQRYQRRWARRHFGVVHVPRQPTNLWQRYSPFFQSQSETDLYCDNTQRSVSVNQDFLHHFFGLSRTAAGRVMKSWRSAPLCLVTFEDLPMDNFSTQRWQMLCDTVGSKSKKLLYIHIKLYQVGHAQAAAMLVQASRQVDHLTIDCRDAHLAGNVIQNYNVLVQALSSRQLPRFSFNLPSTACHVLLRDFGALRRSSGIHVRRMSITLRDAGEIGPRDALALNDCLGSDAIGTFEALSFQNLRFTSLESWQTFCQGIARSRAIKCLEISLGRATAGYATPFVDAVAATKISKLRVSGWPGDENLSAFLASFARRLPELEILVLSFDELFKANDGGPNGQHRAYPPLSSDLSAVVRAAAACPALMELTLPTAHYCQALDESLAHSVRYKTPSLKFLGLSHPILAPDEDCVSYPMFVAALKSNVKIDAVKLQRPLSLQPQLSDPWCDEFKKQVSVVIRLNGSGRSYLKDQPSNQRVGFCVLARVRDDLDCLFFHLNENPSLCLRRR